MPLSVYRNNSSEKFKKHYLRVKLKGNNKNTLGIGAKVSIYQKGKIQYLQAMPNRGFQSSSDHVMVFGLGDNTSIDSLSVVWQDDKKQVLKNPKANAEIFLEQKNANLTQTYPDEAKSLPFSDITTQTGLDYIHVENDFVDYNRDATLKQM